MASSKSYIGEMMLMAAMMGGMGTNMPLRNKDNEIDFRPRDKPIPKGCKRYTFPGFDCIASSEKSARKKFDKWRKKNSANPKTEEG